MIISYAYNISKQGHLTVLQFGCDHVAAVSNESSQVLTVYDLDSDSIAFPPNSHIIIYATPVQSNQNASWYISGGEGNFIDTYTNFSFTLGGDATVGVVCGSNFQP